ncbi:hypothetical protein FCG40_11630 [Fimbriimonadia bacterium ATM]|nr:MAG: hypothetical protein EDM73_12645 [Armatimonadota bacterium]MBC6968365.1 hypothetical protein [Armatimonadota bacterium]MCE7898797.1 hypothetical protein [Armatimonadetes bacterium ATM1]MDL1929626.1 hypothetical protein [Fimbriimonadia bacterium ATM]RIJ94162.1 MAG: hypothetical protein DCC45_13040 [Armatimonadota bacterium]
MTEIPRAFRIWFYAAAIYNAAWALAVCAFPSWCIDVLGIRGLVSQPFLQVLGMMVGTFAYGYWLLAREPKRYSGLIWIALMGKVLGPIGFVVYAIRGELPWAFGATIVTNDLIWLPAFATFALRYAR